LLPVRGIAARRATAGRPYVGRGPGERGLLRIPVVMGSRPMPTALKSRGHSRPALAGRSRLPAGRGNPGQSRREHGEDPSHFLVRKEFLRQTPSEGFSDAGRTCPKCLGTGTYGVHGSIYGPDYELRPRDFKHLGEFRPLCCLTLASGPFGRRRMTLFTRLPPLNVYRRSSSCKDF